MKLRTKVFLLIGSTLTVLFLLMNFSVSRILSDDFSVLEQREMREHLFRATDALDNKIDALSVKLGDWAQWDDTYQYVADHNAAYIQSNLPDATFDVLQINFVVIFDERGEIVFKKYVADEEERSFPSSIEEHLTQKIVAASASLHEPYKNLVNVPEGLMIYAMHPITSSDGLADPRGIMVFGYAFEEEMVADLSRLTHLEIAFAFPDDEMLDAGFAEARERLDTEEYFVATPEETDVLSGYVRVSGRDDVPVLILRVNMPREIYQRGQASIALFGTLNLLSIAIFGGVVFYVLGHFVLNKLLYLSNEVVRVRQSGNAHVNLQISGKDEFSALAEEINRMLASIREIESIRKESERRFRTVADTAPVMIWMSDVDQKFTYVNKVWLDFTGRPLTKELGDGWKECVHPDDLQKSELVFGDAFRKRVEFHIEYRLKNALSEYRWVFVRGVPQFSSENTFIGYVGSCVDITERKVIDEEKEEYINEVERMNKIMVARELKMIELKEKVRDLENTIGISNKA